MELAKAIWNSVVLAVILASFGILGRVTYSVGKSALVLHQRNLFDLAKWNHQLVDGKQ